MRFTDHNPLSSEEGRTECDKDGHGLSLPQDCIGEIPCLLLCLSELLSTPGQTRNELADLAIDRLSDALESRDYTNARIRLLVVNEIAQLRMFGGNSIVGDSAKSDSIGKAVQLLHDTMLQQSVKLKRQVLSNGPARL